MSFREFVDLTPPPAPTIEACIARVEARFGVSRAWIVESRGRTKNVALARHVAMYVARRAAGASYPKIGRVFRRDHTSVMHAVRKVERLIVDDHELRAHVDAIMQALS